MAKRNISKELKKKLEQYVTKISEHYAVDAVYLFGSFADNKEHEHSDIDIAVVSKDITDEISDMGKLFALTWGIDTRIEPHAFNTSEFRENETPIIDTIIRTGIPIYMA